MTSNKRVNSKSSAAKTAGNTLVGVEQKASKVWVNPRLNHSEANGEVTSTQWRNKSSLGSISMRTIRQAEKKLTDKQLDKLYKSMAQNQRLMDVAIAFTERLKVRGLIDCKSTAPTDEEREATMSDYLGNTSEFEITNRIYNLLLDGQILSDIESSDDLRQLFGHTKMQKIASRLHIYGAIKNDELEVELEDKAGRPTICLDDSKVEAHVGSAEPYNQRKIWAFKNEETDRTELLEVEYNMGGEEDLQSVYDDQQIDLSRVHFNVS